MKTRLILPIVACTLFSYLEMPHAAAESKKLKRAQRSVSQLEKDNSDCRDTSSARLATIRGLREQIATLKASNSQLADQLNDQKAHVKDLSEISGSQAQSIKKSFESIESRDAYIRALQAEMARKDSMTNGLMNNLKKCYWQHG